LGDPHVTLAQSFGTVADSYHRLRPPYSQPLLDLAVRVLELPHHATVLDLAAGTGRLTHELVQRFDRVIAVEPDDEMRRLIADGEVLAGAAEAIPLPAESVDAVFVGEAFHWFDAAAAIAEVARVLRPGGGLALISVHWWETEPPLPDAALELLAEPYERFRSQRNPPWDDAFAGTPFEPLLKERFEDEVTLDPDTLLELYSTTSSHAALPADERAALLARVRALIDGPYRLPIKHELTWTLLA
jgi:SAM-dependent methyltransferase